MTTASHKKYNILIISASTIVREGLKAIIKRHVSQQGYITEVSNTNEIQELLAERNYNLLIMDDPKFPPLSLNLTELKFKYPNLKLLHITADSKDIKDDGLVFHIRYLATDEIWNKTLNTLLPPPAPMAKNKSSFRLSQREKEILKTLVSGKSSKEISDILHISLHTVSTHRKNIINKLGIKTISGLTIYAVMNDIIRLDEMKEI